MTLGDVRDFASSSVKYMGNAGVSLKQLEHACVYCMRLHDALCEEHGISKDDSQGTGKLPSSTVLGSKSGKAFRDWKAWFTRFRNRS